MDLRLLRRVEGRLPGVPVGWSCSDALSVWVHDGVALYRLHPHTRPVTQPQPSYWVAWPVP